MNINDIEAGECQVNSLADIFEHQHALYLKYKDIEGMDWEGDTVSIHTLNGQRWLKDFLWRTTEEMTESYEAMYMAGDINLPEEAREQHRQHQIEELADALHFFVEFCIMAGIKAEDLTPVEEVEERFKYLSVRGFYWKTVYNLGLIGNTLKNKPWKQHQMKTDTAKFRKYVGEAYFSLLGTFFEIGATSEDVYDFYFRKAKVNQFRQRSNY